ncbi:MAG: DUF5696 domain-containing protein [Anaerolineales bacterium]|nr:DUF5696 domain-containing protein [Anaerolineales bacterium]MCX7608402.1 DUF5696 domain-containing protein [Anaerolineales bacterium]
MNRFCCSLLLLFAFLSIAAPVLAAPPTEEIPEGYEVIAENANFRLYVHPERLAFKVLDKRSGYLWHSNLDEKSEGDRLNRVWTAFAQSGVSIDYLDAKANAKRASLVNAEHMLTIERLENGLRAQITFVEPAISLALHLFLEDSGVRVEVPAESIREEGEFRLGILHLYPWMGATRGAQVRGYMFIPDGSGTLIEFSEQTKAKNMYYGRYYGLDLGMLTTLPFDPSSRRPYPISMAVIGMVHQEGKNAYLAILERGASYAEIQAHPAGIITNFNFLYNAFIYNESYFQRTSRSGDGVTVVQPQTNQFDIVLHYRFLTGEEASYVGMARNYQQYLLEKGQLRRQTMPQEGIGIRLEFLGAERERILFWNRTIPMTTLGQMTEILSQLEVANPQVIYYGWQPQGASALFPTRLKLDNQLGSVSDLRSLAESLQQKGGSLALYFDPIAAPREEQRSFSRYDLAMSITGDYMSGYRRGKASFYFNQNSASHHFETLTADIAEKAPLGLALDHVSTLLFSDFRRNTVLNREESIALMQKWLGDSPIPLALYTPNDYLWAYTHAYYDIPLGDSGYIYTARPVPFLQIVLSGYVPYYGEALNFSPDVRGDLLRHAEYGIYPSFFLTYEETAKILRTNSSWIYVSTYTQLEAEIEESYAWLNALLAPAQGASIVNHQEIKPQVFAVTYSNGWQILVNYREQPVTVNGLTIPARDAIGREVNP